MTAIEDLIRRVEALEKQNAELRGVIVTLRRALMHLGCDHETMGDVS